tara:strand:+ start:780 stop:1073 length:294 start_codon:yes stop_codon:yes gene_type:complete
MKFENISDYEKYIVLSDRSDGKLGWTWSTYLNFKTVMEVINRIAVSDNSTYSYNGNIYNRRITSTEARQVVSNVMDAKWNQKTSVVLSISNQMGLKI